MSKSVVRYDTLRGLCQAQGQDCSGGTDGQIEFQSNQEPFMSEALQLNRGISAQHWNFERTFEQRFMEWLDKHNLDQGRRIVLVSNATNMEGVATRWWRSCSTGPERSGGGHPRGAVG